MNNIGRYQKNNSQENLQRDRVKSIAVSLIAGSIILACKIWAYQLSGSKALESDALESIVNVVAAAFGLGAVIFAGRPADRNHPYGHGKIEYFAAVFEGGLISLAAVLIFFEAIAALVVGAPLRDLSAGMAFNLLAGLLNGLLGLFLIRSGRRLSSQAIEADGQHVISDFYTTIGILLGLLAVRLTGLEWLDPVLAMGISAVLVRTGYLLVRRAAAGLLDEEDVPLIERLVAEINKIKKRSVEKKGFITAHGLRTIRAGRYVHVDVHLVVPEYHSVVDAHDEADHFEHALLEASGIEGECHVHLDPCRRHFCVQCDDAACPIRKESFVRNVELTVHEAVEAEPIN